ncbi:intradiol ring-cleavage dioxygenase [Catalinimonas alkaloidigena]|nr:intradiol ring-cleavage dioxygenase [Catalinimonas alkaloidigena]
MYIAPPDQIDAVDTSAGWWEAGQKLLVTGTVYQPDGRTPAPNVLLYYWQTDHRGYYAPSDDMPTSTARHGHIRGWLKTDERGHYALYTIRPGPYPNRDIPAHIHVLAKEPDLPNEYYIDEWVFDDDRLLTGAKRRALENRGGSGVLRVEETDGRQVAEHNVVLGLHIPGYPKRGTSEGGARSGLHIGEDQPSFTPFHAWGPDRGTRTCPVCKYGRHQGILYFVGNHPDWDEIRLWLQFLEAESVRRNEFLKVYFVYGNENGYEQAARVRELSDLGEALSLQHVALTFVPSFADTASDIHLNRLNPDVGNTFVVYRRSNIVEKWIDLKPTPVNFQRISRLLDRTRSPSVALPDPAIR